MFAEGSGEELFSKSSSPVLLKYRRTLKTVQIVVGRRPEFIGEGLTGGIVHPNGTESGLGRGLDGAEVVVKEDGIGSRNAKPV